MKIHPMYASLLILYLFAVPSLFSQSPAAVFEMDIEPADQIVERF
ncbi:hypothetical protein [Rhodohalobacter sp. 8-1]